MINKKIPKVKIKIKRKTSSNNKTKSERWAKRERREENGENKFLLKKFIYGKNEYTVKKRENKWEQTIPRKNKK